MRWRTGRYERKLSVGNGCEIVEITWEPRSRTSKHDHNVDCTVSVLEGEVFEVKNGETFQHPQGSEFRERAGDTHIVCNRSDRPAVTRHVYEAKLHMQIFADDPQDIAALALIAAER